MDVRVAPCAIHMVMNGFTGAALATSSRNMLSTDCVGFRADGATTHGASRVVHDGEATTSLADIGVPTGAVCVVNFGAACACENTHLFEEILLIRCVLLRN